MIRLLWAYILRVTKNKGSEAAVRHRIALILALTVVVLFGVLFGSVRAAAAVAYVDVYYGEVLYQHITNVQVSRYNYYPAGTTLGSILTNGTVSSCWSGPHVHYEAEGNRPTYPSYWQHQYDDAHDVPTYVWYPYSDWLVRLYN